MDRFCDREDRILITLPISFVKPIRYTLKVTKLYVYMASQDVLVFSRHTTLPVARSRLPTSDSDDAFENRHRSNPTSPFSPVRTTARH